MARDGEHGFGLAGPRNQNRCGIGGGKIAARASSVRTIAEQRSNVSKSLGYGPFFRKLYTEDAVFDRGAAAPGRVLANHWTVVRTAEGWRIKTRKLFLMDGSEPARALLLETVSK